MDWTTTIVAGLGILGTLLAPIVTHKLESGRQAKVDARDDRATLRARLVETYRELDRLQAVGNTVTVGAIKFAQGDKEVRDLPSFDLGLLRANIGLYFPECAEDLKEYDEQTKERAKELRAKLEANPVTVGAFFMMETSAQVTAMAAKVRAKLDARAAAIRI